MKTFKRGLLSWNLWKSQLDILHQKDLYGRGHTRARQPMDRLSTSSVRRWSRQGRDGALGFLLKTNAEYTLEEMKLDHCVKWDLEKPWRCYPDAELNVRCLGRRGRLPVV